MALSTTISNWCMIIPTAPREHVPRTILKYDTSCAVRKHQHLLHRGESAEIPHKPHYSLGEGEYTRALCISDASAWHTVTSYYASS